MPRTKKDPRADGRYEKKVYLGVKDGKRLYRAVYGKSPTEVSEKAMQLKLALHKGIDVTAERDTFYVWAQRWLATKERKLSQQRYKKYVSCVEHQLGELKYMPISKIRAYDVQDIINDLSRENPNTGKPSSEKTLKDVVSVVRQIFDIAVKNRVVQFNPADAVDIPAEPSEQIRRALSDDEQQWIINTPHRARRAAMIMMYSGLRRGELIPLTWGDIDLKKRAIDVNKTVVMLNGKSVVQQGRAKTKGSIRTVNLPMVLVDFLQKERPPDAKPGDLVCTSARDVMLSDSAWKRLWNSYLADLNMRYGNVPENLKSKHDPHGVPFLIPRITAHWLRHTFITIMYLADVDVLTAMQQAGHADIKTTLEIYTHLDEKFKRKNMDKLDDYLSKKS